MKQKWVCKEEFEEAFKSYERNNAPGHDGLDVTFITSVHELIRKPQLRFSMNQ